MSEINFKNSDYPEDVFHKVTDFLLRNKPIIKTIETLAINTNVPKESTTADINNLYTSLTTLNISLLDYIHKYNEKHTKSPTQIPAPKPIFEYTNITNETHGYGDIYGSGGPYGYGPYESGVAPGYGPYESGVAHVYGN